MLVLFTETEIINKSTLVDSLIKKLAQGDRDALSELYTEISTDVYAFALSKCENVHDAEDAMQDAFVNIYKYAKLYKSRGNPMAWIFTIVMNIIKRRRTLNSRHITLDDSIGEQNITADDSIESELIKSDLVRLLMKELGERERDIVIMHAVSGLRHREIAKLLDLPLSTVLSAYSRAMKKLKNKLEGGSI